MKLHYLFVLFLLIQGATPVQSQTVNWERLEKAPVHVINLNAGLQHGIIYGMDYSYYNKTSIPLMVHVFISIPSGKKLADDFKIQPGIQIQCLKYKDFRLTTRIDGIIRRRHETTTVTLVNMGADVSACVGYYRSGWFIAAETGLDKAIATHFKHSKEYCDNYPGVQDGWYKPFTGGNFYYGLQTGISFGKQDIYLKAGKMIAQDFKSKLQVPFYGQVGYSIRLTDRHPTISK